MAREGRACQTAPALDARRPPRFDLPRLPEQVGGAVRKHLNKIVVVIVAIVFTTWFLLWPDEEEPLAPPSPAVESGGASPE